MAAPAEEVSAGANRQEERRREKKQGLVTDSEIDELSEEISCDNDKEDELVV